MLDRRLPLYPYLGLWLATVALQGAAFQVWGEGRLALAIGAALLLQILKIFLCIPRLNDLGRPPDDALFAVIPIGNLALWSWTLQPTPREEDRARRRAGWSGEMMAATAYWRGVSGAIRALPAVLPILLALAALSAAGEVWLVEWVGRLKDLDAGTLASVTQGVFAATVLLGVYTLIQTVRYKTVSRASWLPSFFLLPAVFLLVVVSMSGKGLAGGAPSADPMQGIAPLLLATSAWSLAWSCIVGAALAVVWVTVAEDTRDGNSRGIGEIAGRMLRRFADVAAPHGAATLAIQIGMQVVIPGIYYAMQYAFVDVVAVSEPEKGALSTSSRAAKGINRRIFKIYVLSLATSILLGWSVAIPIEWAVHAGDPGFDGAALVTQVLAQVPMLLLLMPLEMTTLSTWTLLGCSVTGMLAWGASNAGFAHMYWDRTAKRDAG